jgi:hypothetical protein
MEVGKLKIMITISIFDKSSMGFGYTNHIPKILPDFWEISK